MGAQELDERNAGVVATPQLNRRAPLLWAFVVVAHASIIAGGTFALLRTERGPKPAFLAAPNVTSTSRLRVIPPAPEDSLSLAGSGSNLPLVHVLVKAFRARSPLAKIVVHESIGSSGGIRAVRDGAVNVGLISRALTEEERREGLVAVPHARVAVVVAANPSVPDSCASRGHLLHLYRSSKARWIDGSGVVILQREQGDSSFAVFSSIIPGLAIENDAAYRQGRWRVLYNDRTMQEALMATEGAVGIFDLGSVEVQKLPLKVLCIDGVKPTMETLRSGRYRYAKDLSFVTRGPAPKVADEFFRFVLSAEGRGIAEGVGYLPLPIGPAQRGGPPP